MSKRDTQFKGFAKLLWDDVAPMFNNHFIEMDNCEIQEAEKTKQSIIECFAECAYDLVRHACEHSGILEQDWRLTTEAVMNAIPDMTQWREEGKEKESI